MHLPTATFRFLGANAAKLLLVGGIRLRPCLCVLAACLCLLQNSCNRSRVDLAQKQYRHNRALVELLTSVNDQHSAEFAAMRAKTLLDEMSLLQSKIDASPAPTQEELVSLAKLDATYEKRLDNQLTHQLKRIRQAGYYQTPALSKVLSKLSVE